MKDIMKEVEGKVKFSMADSTMMLLVQQAMDKAHEKIKTKHGLLLRLNAISIFYELAVLQLESCLSFVRQETDKLESNHEEVVRDLREIKDRLHHRLLETELAILEKDRELLETSKNEESLRNVLESKETELVHLQDLERNRSHNKIGDFIKEDEFSELKSSVDQQVMNLRQKLETEYDEVGGETEDPSGVDVLKGTMDLAFNKMHHAIFLSELGPIEQSWRWSIERDSMALLIKGFMNGLEEKMEKVMMVVRDYESGFKDRVCSIHRVVECLESQIDEIIIHRSSSPKSCVATAATISSSPSSIDCEISDDKEAKADGEEEQYSSNFPVSKLIKSHESIIRRKSEELVPPKIDPVKQQKSCNSSSSKQAIDDIFAGLDSLMSLNTKLFEHLFDDDDGGRHEHAPEVVMDENLDDVWMKMQKNRSVFSDNAVEEKEDAEMKLIILEDTYLTLLKGLITDEITNNRKAEEDKEEEIKSENIEQGIECMNCVENLKWEKDYENLREDEEFRQELNWIIVTELLREVTDTVENHAKIEANNKRIIEEEVNRACLKISLVYDDFDFKIQEKLKMVTLRLRNLKIKIDSTMDCIAEIRRKESVYRTAFVLSSENLRKAETEVDLLGDQVDSHVKLLQKTLWTFHQHPLLLCNNSDISEISKLIKKELSSEDS